MSAPFVYRRPVRFEEVDAARIVFFSRFFAYCHEAMEAFFAPLVGGYAGLIQDRDIGLPAVHVEASFLAPLRYGDVIDIAVQVTRIGSKSCTLRYDLVRVRDRVTAATIAHTCALSRLDPLAAIAIPEDVRVLLEAHLAPSSGD